MWRLEIMAGHHREWRVCRAITRAPWQRCAKGGSGKEPGGAGGTAGSCAARMRDSGIARVVVSSLQMTETCVRPFVMRTSETTARCQAVEKRAWRAMTREPTRGRNESKGGEPADPPLGVS